ncbi:hypothetical protein SAY86_006772 [Trapa natans]|uniref:Uncharacterized protein n=1 Tax=Trapa natans TaxID=22666 RepID=A0AAN7L789_TRANT|nr:hypothetical protein SAY86_006772 [Trapa natans]
MAKSCKGLAMELVKCLSESDCVKVFTLPPAVSLLMLSFSSSEKLRCIRLSGSEAILQGVRGREEPLHTERVRWTEGDLLQLQERPGTSSVSSFARLRIFRSFLPRISIL